MTDITIHMCKNDGLENYLEKKIREILSHSWESGFISGRLPDDPGGFTCMHLDLNFKLTVGVKLSNSGKIVHVRIVSHELMDFYQIYMDT